MRYVLILLAVLGILYAFKPVTFDLFAPVGTTYMYTWATDTITNTENDTLYLPYRVIPYLSDRQGCYSLKRTSISGTASTTAKLEQSPYPYTGSTPPTAGWTSVLNSAGAAAATAAADTVTANVVFYIPNSYGMTYRYIVDGSGTQSTSYVLRAVLKKKL